MAANKLFDPGSDQPFALSRSKVELLGTLAAIRQTLSAAAPPPNTGDCEYCTFAEEAARAGE